MPQNIPSFLASSLDVFIASSFETGIISSIMFLFNISGTDPAPMPCILWGPGLPPERTADVAGSTAIHLREGFLILKPHPHL